MKVRPTCAACILLTRSRELERLGELSLEDSLAGFRLIAEVTGAYLGPDIELTLLATVSFRKLKNILGSDDPYAQLKKEGIEKAKRISSEIQKYIARLDGRDKFNFAVKVAAAGNAADYARPYLDAYLHTLESILKIEMKLNELSNVYDDIAEGKIHNIVYILDGAVEALYDAILIRVLRELGASVTAIVKSEAFEDDATINDVIHAGIAGIADDVIESGSDAASIIPDEVQSEVLDVLREADLVILKGAHNYIHFANNVSLARRVYGVMRVPCHFLAKILNVPLGSYVAIKLRPLT